MIRVDIDKNVILVKASHRLVVVDKPVDKLVLCNGHLYDLYGRLQGNCLLDP